MPPSTVVMWGGVVGAVIAGSGWAVSGVIAFVLAGGGSGPPGSSSAYSIEWLHTIAEGGMLLWLVGSHMRQSAGYGRLGTAGFVAAFVGTAFVFLATLVNQVAGSAVSETFYNIVFGLGLLGWVTGFPLLGIATSWAKLLPRWAGLPLIAFFPLIFLILALPRFYGGGGILVGIVWLALGFALFAARERVEERPSPVT
jgi:hypothetical protein